MKTSSTTYGGLKLEDDIQAAAYAYAARQLYGPDARLVYAVLVKKKVPSFQLVEVYKDETDFARLASLIQVAEAMLDAGIAYSNPTWMCSGCASAWSGAASPPRPPETRSARVVQVELHLP